MTVTNTDTVQFDLALFSETTVKKAAYRFTNEASISFNKDGNELSCSITPASEETELSDLILRFQNEVLDQDLREKIAEETAGIRNVILAQAFSKTGLQNS